MSWRLRSRLVIELVDGLGSDWFKEDSSLNSKEVESVDEILFFFFYFYLCHLHKKIIKI